jgi:Na+-transporting NADH:ubiquinone oxidoreductase subunit E
MPDISPLMIIFASIFTNNILLSNFLGMCSFVAISKNLKASFGLGMAVTFVAVITTAVNYWVFRLLEYAGLEYLQFIIFIIIIAGSVQFVEIVIERVSETLYYTLGIFLPLITVNCAILGILLFMVIRKYSYIQSLGFALGSGLGWTLAICIMASIRKRLRFAPIPHGLEESGITMITTGLLALAFMGFAGIVNIG